jgi:hypothetical protein
MIVRGLDEALGTRVLDRRCSVAPTARLALRASFLIEPSQFAECRQAIAELRERRPDLRMLVSGPWSPYSFVSRDRGGEQQPLGQSLNDLSRLLTPPSTSGEHAARSAVPATV